MSNGPETKEAIKEAEVDSKKDVQSTLSIDTASSSVHYITSTLEPL